MSIHRSLVPVSKLRRHRNVLSRAERLEKLKKEERWKEEESVFGLPKVRNIMMRARKKTKKAATDAEAAAAEGVPGEAPAEGAEKKEEKKDEKAEKKTDKKGDKKGDRKK
ncbi:MAG: small basic protein [Planctomycetota bacterium]|jgi:small basic protein (TIGR04137 family)